jgi:hypothetical protein
MLALDPVAVVPECSMETHENNFRPVVDLGSLVMDIQLELAAAGIDLEAPRKMTFEELRTIDFEELKKRYPLHKL